MIDVQGGKVVSGIAYRMYLCSPPLNHSDKLDYVSADYKWSDSEYVRLQND